MKKRIISLVLAALLLFLSTVPVFAAEKEKFISDVALIYKDSAEEAKKAIEDTGWILYDKNLNPNADFLFDDGVYLIYKETTDVEEAITDLRVMNMYGGYSSSNYEKQLEDTKESYAEIIKYVRVCLEEFKALYDSGDEMALLAHRQMNFYKDVKVSESSDETDLLIGDLFLSDPSDEALLRVLMEGNSLLVANLIKLLAIGISGTGDNTLSARLEKIYSSEATYNTEENRKKAEILAKALDDIRSNIMRYDELKDNYDLEKDELTEDDYNFALNFAAIALVTEQIKLGDITLAELIRNRSYTVSDLYPMAEAFTDAQIALAEMGQIDSVLQAHSPSKPMEDLVDLVDQVEDGLKNEMGEFIAVDVYIGVDRSVFEGTFAMTNAAERQQALNGESMREDALPDPSKEYVIAALALTGTSLGVTLISTLMCKTAGSLYYYLKSVHGSISMASSFSQKYLNFIAYKLGPNLPYVYMACAGLLLIAVGITEFSSIYNYFNPKYSQIPDVMIDVVETDLGDRYVKYNAAKTFKNKKQNADFNAYEGKQWIALYYTKDATAGKCLTPNFEHSDSDSTVLRRYQGISMFGETKAYNLNSHVFNKNAPSVFLTVRYSNTKKAAADIPEVVGSMINESGIYAICVVGGIGLGVGGTLMFKKFVKNKASAKRKKETDEKTATEI